MTTMRVVGECFFWYRLTRVFPVKFHRAVKRLCVCVCVTHLHFGANFRAPVRRHRSKTSCRSAFVDSTLSLSGDQYYHWHLCDWGHGQETDLESLHKTHNQQQLKTYPVSSHIDLQTHDGSALDKCDLNIWRPTCKVPAAHNMTPTLVLIAKAVSVLERGPTDMHRHRYIHKQ